MIGVIQAIDLFTIDVVVIVVQLVEDVEKDYKGTRDPQSQTEYIEDGIAPVLLKALKAMSR